MCFGGVYAVALAELHSYDEGMPFFSETPASTNPLIGTNTN
jgi:hypothetical protein